MVVKVEYVKANKEIFDLREEFKAGLLSYHQVGAGFVPINSIEDLGDSLRGQYLLFIKTEVEIPWYERLDDFSYPLALTREDQNGEVELSAFLKEEINPDCDWFKECRPATKAELQILMDNAPE